MPRRRRVSKRRALSPAERLYAELEASLPPSPLVRRGVDALGLDGEVVRDGEGLDDVAPADDVGLDYLDESGGVDGR